MSGLAPAESPVRASSEAINRHSTAAAKIAFLRSLFRGREDVYPRRFESLRTGKSGYAPACANEWVRGVCEKPQVKCAVCPHRRFLPVTDEVIRWHLSGRDGGDQPFVAGVYPLLVDETCHFLAADFDKAGWQSDALAFVRGCRRVGLAAALERSRSGHGGHVWLFFEQAVPAALARRLGSYLASLELVHGNQVYIAKEGLPPALRNRLLRIAAFQNPEFYRAQAMRLSTFRKPRVIACAEDHPQHIGLPRGCLDDVRHELTSRGIRPIVRDHREGGRPVDVAFTGQLRPEQMAAAEAMVSHDTGVLAATTAFGKTVVAAWLIARRRVNTLVLVHRRQLLDQWVERLSTFLGLPAKSIGRVSGGRARTTGSIDVALIQSLIKKGVVDDRVADYGHVVVDECHHVSAQTFEAVVRQAKARFVVGLSATVTRKDGRHPIVTMQCGPVRHRVDARAQAVSRPSAHIVLVQPTGFRSRRTPETDRRMEFQALYQELVADGTRDRRIADDVIDAVHSGRSPLVLTERNDHLDSLEHLLAPAVPHLVVLRAGAGKKDRRAMAERLATIPTGEGRVVLATGKYVGEGFDDARLDSLFLTLPVSWRGTVAQYAGRLHRSHDSKREVRVYDYADVDVPMLARMFDRRCRGYEAIGYTVLLPASAMPGWPVDVRIPADPEWKRDYAGSVRRLIRDGVDTPLARLFVHAVRPVTPDADGLARARSATAGGRYQQDEGMRCMAKKDCVVGSGNVFEDLGHARPAEALAKAELARKIGLLITKRGLTQAAAAEVLQVDQPKVSALVRGRLAGFSLDRLVRFLVLLGSDVEIVVKPRARAAGRARVMVA